jgi:hypothetical protein
MRYRTVLIVTLLTVLSCLPPPARAVQFISSCGATCTGDCVLVNDLVCPYGTGAAVTLNGAFATLDMQGHDIDCHYGCTNGVLMTGAQSGVFSTGTQDPGDPAARIVGRFNRGIDCQNKTASTVQDITLQGLWQAAIFACTQVSDNTITGAHQEEGSVSYPTVSNIGIYYQSSVSGDFIVHNYVDGVRRAIVRAPSGANTQLLITDNIINHRNYSPGSAQPAAIDMASPVPHSQIIRNNVFTGDGGAPIATSPNQSNTYVNNVCKFPLAGCANCVAAGQCVASGTTTSP